MSGFGLPAVGGFGQPLPGAPAQPKVQFKGEKGPGYTDPTAAHWSTSIDVSAVPPVLRDDVLYDNLPKPLQDHLALMHAFIQAEKDTLVELDKTVRETKNSMGQVKRKMAAMRGGENSFEAARLQANSLSTALDDYKDSIRGLQDSLTAAGATWDPAAGARWALGDTSRDQPASEFFKVAVENVAARMSIVGQTITELEASLLPEQNLRARQQQQQQHQMVTSANSSGISSVLTGGVAGTTVPSLSHHNHFQTAVSAAPQDAASLILATLRDQKESLLAVAAKVQQAHIRADMVRALAIPDNFVGVFAQVKGHQWAPQPNDDTDEDAYDGMLLWGAAAPSPGQGLPSSRRAAGGGMRQPLVGAAGHHLGRKSNRMTFDPQLNKSTNPPAAAPAAAAGFGVPQTPAPPAAGFGAPQTAPAAGFGAPQTAAAAGFGVPQTPAPPAAGFGGTPSAFGASPLGLASNGSTLSPIGAGAGPSPSPNQPEAGDQRPTKKKGR
jgi:hypothetical protein